MVLRIAKLSMADVREVWAQLVALDSTDEKVAIAGDSFTIGRSAGECFN